MSQSARELIEVEYAKVTPCLRGDPGHTWYDAAERVIESLLEQIEECEARCVDWAGKWDAAYKRGDAAEKRYEELERENLSLSESVDRRVKP